MDFQWTPEQEMFLNKFASWLEKNYPDGYDPGKHKNFDSVEARVKAYKKFQRILFKGGYAGLQLPKEYGGQGMTTTEQALVTGHLARNCHELIAAGQITHGMIVPTIFHRGTEEQKREFLPRIMDGTHLWCQGFSEPDAGSDVANVNTMATREGDHYLVNGQKVWTSYSYYSDYSIMLVRTSRSGPKHKGLSYLLVDMTLPGVEVRPLRQITGEAEYCEVFLTDVKVPADMLVGNEGDGWSIALTTLMFERAAGDVFATGFQDSVLTRLASLARRTIRSGKLVSQDPIFRQQYAQSYAEMKASQCLALRGLSKQTRGEIPGPEGSIGKLFICEALQKVGNMAVSIQGPRGQIMGESPWCIDDGYWQYEFLYSRSDTIAGGTSEIQRNIIGERVLGLPKESARELSNRGR